MKTSKSPEAEVTPSKKKLKQARLPFKLISDVPSSPESPQSRKRKLSAPEQEPITKIGRISKENDIKDLVVISDDEDKEKQSEDTAPTVLNPFVKLVDTAWKKKLQKSKKKKNSKSKSEDSANENCVNSDLKQTEPVEMMEVDNGNEVCSESDPKEDSVAINSVKNNEKSKNKTSPKTAVVRKSSRNSKKDDESVVIVSEDSSNSISGDKSKPKDSRIIETVEKNTSEVKKKDDKENEVSEKGQEVPKIEVTPKRSSRTKAKEEKADLNSSILSSKLDESISSSPSTPKPNKSAANCNLDESIGEISTANLTPKQLQKRLESAKKREEREKEKQERDKKKQMEKEDRVRQKQEKEEQRKREREEKEEQKRKEREEKEEQRKKEKEEKDKQKEAEKKLREEKEEQKRKEREEKEDQKRKEREAKEEEKRKKQEALELERQEQELKKKKAAEAFVNFFVPKQKVDKDHSTQAGPMSKSSVLSSFTIKSDMRLAPTVRANFDSEDKQNLDSMLEKQSYKDTYLKNLRQGKAKPLTSGKTWPLCDKDDDDVMVIEDELPPLDGGGEIVTCDSTVREKLRPKLFSFHENRRPPYWGTWRKKSSCIRPRRPFGLDGKQLDYEADSDDDWEEEQEGESLDGSAAGSEDEQDADEYEVDNEVFVPHGYLSDEEATMDGEDDMLSLSPETQKARLKHLEDEFESEMKKPTEKLKPRLYGLLWQTPEGGKPEQCVDALWNYFSKFAMIINKDISTLLQPPSETEETDKKKIKKKKVIPEGEQQSPKTEKKKKESKEGKKIKVEAKKNTPEVKKPTNQPGINAFLTKKT